MKNVEAAMSGKYSIHRMIKLLISLALSEPRS
jgi:hypothetical protein